jgi:isopentenyl-diphosphate delta-isomerase
MPQIPIVDEEDNIVGYKERSEILWEDIYRVASLWVTNSQGEVLLARRAYTKAHSPGVWGPAVAGTVEVGESYDSNIVKEAKEELGIEGIEFTLDEHRRTTGNRNYFSQSYKVVLDWPIDKFRPQLEEVAEVKWFDLESLRLEL